MNGVIGMTGLLLDTPLSAEQREYTETVRRSGEALLTIINDVLDFSKIEAGKLELERADFELVVSVEDVLELLAERAHAQGLDLASLVEPGVPACVSGDPGRLRQVLTNLVANAVKFTHQGQVRVQVSLVEQRQEMALVRFAVTDTGIGIPVEVQGGLFTPFTQADGSITRRYGGTGLGLVISKRLVELMGGTIGVQSAPGQGSTFWFTLPLPIRAAPPSAGAAPRPGLAGMRVLCVDDNATNRAILEAQLALYGVRVECVADGSTGLARLRGAQREGDPFALAVLDYQMPEMDGYEATAAIRRRETTPEARLPIIALTAHAMQGDRERSLAAGMDDHLVKPFGEEHLRAMLRKWLPGAAGVETAPAHAEHRAR